MRSGFLQKWRIIMKWQEIPTPCYVVDEKKLKQNLKILQNLEQETGCHVLLAQKAFSMFSLYPLIGQYISGTTASANNLGFADLRKRAGLRNLI